MWGNKKSGSRGSGKTTLIAEGTQVIGDVLFEGHLEVEGTIQGNVAAEEERDALLRVLGKGCVEGEIRAPRIVINGVVNGDVYCLKELELAPRGRVNGNVYYSQVEMSAGAEVNGSLTHLSEARDKGEDEEGGNDGDKDGGKEAPVKE